MGRTAFPQRAQKDAQKMQKLFGASGREMKYGGGLGLSGGQGS